MNPTRAEALRSAVTAEAALVAAIANGDISGLGTLFDRHGASVRHLLARLGMPASDLDDLVQETFLDLVHAAPRFRPDAAVRPWLFGLSAVVARRHRRFIARLFARLQKWTSEPAPERGATPEERCALSAEAMRAAHALERLSVKKREAFVLVALEGMSGEEAAAALHIPVATVWTRLHHARRELRDALAEDA